MKCYIAVSFNTAASAAPSH